MISTAELIIVAVIAIMMLVIIAGLILLIAHVYRLTRQVRAMEERLRDRESGQDKG
jgi:uncharacterized protein HemY